MEFKGTKGKWYIDHNISSINDYGVYTMPISTMNCREFIDVYGDDQEVHANAQLIVHAPEMLEMLKKLSSIIDGYLQEQSNNNECLPPSVIDQNTKAKELIIKATTIEP